MALDDLIEALFDAILPDKKNPTLARWTWRIFWAGVILALIFAAYLIIRPKS